MRLIDDKDSQHGSEYSEYLKFVHLFIEIKVSDQCNPNRHCHHYAHGHADWHVLIGCPNALNPKVANEHSEYHKPSVLLWEI